MAKMGRPRIEIDDDKLRTLCGYKLPLADVCFILGCGQERLARHIKEEHGCTFREFRDKCLAKTRALLINKALQAALKENSRTMLIFCLKNLCHWSDKQEISNSEGKSFELKYKVEK